MPEVRTVHSMQGPFEVWIPEVAYLKFLYEDLRLRSGEYVEVDKMILNYAPSGVKENRKDFPTRSTWIRDRHRRWGADAPVIDMDWFSFLALEYDAGKAIALIEYKHRDEWDMHPSARSALRDLAIRADLPAFEVRYDPEEIKFCIKPIFLPVPLESEQIKQGA